MNYDGRAICRDPEMYPDPDTFKPERFLKSNDGATLPLDPRAIAFGIGRRCVLTDKALEHTTELQCIDRVIFLGFALGDTLQSASCTNMWLLSWRHAQF
jgi:hypothetical protein